MVEQVQTNTILKICVIVLSVCMCFMMFAIGGNATPLNAGTATMRVGCDYGVIGATNTDYMVVITDMNTGQDVYSNVFDSNDYVSYRNTNFSITSGHKYLIKCNAPAGYGAQIWITESVNGVENPMHTNMVILEAQEGVTYTIVFYMILQSLGWFDDFVVY